MESVQQINMNNDGMQSIDKLVNVFPNARFVLLHKNKITNIQGISKWKENIEELIL